MVVQFIEVPRIAVVATDDGHRPAGLPSVPLIVLELAPAIVSKVVREILIPYAQSEHVVAGYYKHRDGKMTLGCYLVVTGVGGVPLTCVIGNEIDLSLNAWQRFDERRREFGCYAVTCGPVTDIPGKVMLCQPRWFIESSTFHLDDISPIMSERIFGQK